MKNLIIIIAQLIVCLQMTSCTNDLLPHQESLRSITIDHTNIPTFTQLQGGSVQIIHLQKETVAKTGYDLYNVHELDDNHFLIQDLNLSEITCVDAFGRIVWRINPPHPQMDHYDGIGPIAIDYANREIYIENSTDRELDVYSFEGNYLRSPRRHSNIDLAVLSNGNKLWDISALDPYFFDQKEQVFRFLLDKDDDVSLHHPINYKFDQYISIGYKNRFNRVGEKLQHRRPLEDTLYSVNESTLAITPILSLKFTPGPQFSDFLDNPEYLWPSDHFRKENIPRAHLMVKDGGAQTKLSVWFSPLGS